MSNELAGQRIAFPVANARRSAMARGPWSRRAVSGKTLTSWPSLRTDIRNAGGDWRDEQVVLSPEHGFDLVTSRKPDDLDAFGRQLVKTFARTA
jgi:protease I